MLTMSTTSTTLQLFESLRGTWKLQRHLGVQGHMQGIAHFQPCGEGTLHYQETGKVIMNHGKVFAAHREYAYVYDQHTIAVYFWNVAQQRPDRLLHKLQFHTIQIANPLLVATGTHKCVNDIYQAHYLFVDPQQFRLAYRVQGPRKDYMLTSHFKKVINKRVETK